MQEKSSCVQKQVPFQVNWRIWLKLAVSLGLLAYIIGKIPFADLKAALLHANLPKFLLAFLLVNLCMAVSAVKWRPLLTVLQINIPLHRLLGVYYIGLFANNFLPSSIGGDALRIYHVAKDSGKTAEAAASVVGERLLASLALVFTAAAAMFFLSNQNAAQIYRYVGVLAVVCAVLTAVIFYYPFQETGRLGRFLCRLSEYKKYPGTLALVLLLSFVFQACMVLANVYIFGALGVQLPVYLHFVYVPVIMAVSMLPLSINGLGVREGMYVLFYGFAGVDSATALLCSLLFFTQITVSSLAGGIIMMLRK